MPVSRASDDFLGGPADCAHRAGTTSAAEYDNKLTGTILIGKRPVSVHVIHWKSVRWMNQ